jgi:LPS export ABC transporter protein LptC
MNPLRFAGRLALLVAVGALGLGLRPAVAEDSSVLEVTGMTFVGSRGSANELVLRARRAVYRPDSDLAELELVRVVVTGDETGPSLEMTCDRVELNVETSDFTAEGQIEGVTGDGQRYSAPWVRYQHEPGVVYTEAQVQMVDGATTMRGEGFRFYIRERRFQLGNVSVVATPEAQTP